MPVLGGTSTVKLQDIVNAARAYAELKPVLGASGWEKEPAVSIANDTMQKMLAQNMNWKWNRAAATPFQTVALQQDYVTNVLDLSWVEQGWRVDINNSSTPKPVFGLEAIQDMARTSYQGTPFNISWVPNRLATMGTWSANTEYPTSLGVASTPTSPIQQFIDANGNILFVTTYGTSGSSEPSAPTSSAAGVTVADGTVTWTVADPYGAAFRLAPMPASSGIVWQINPIYQMKAPYFTSLQTTLTPIPDDHVYLFRQGFMAMAYMHAGSPKFGAAYAQWEEALFIALRAADREQDNTTLYPSTSLMGGESIGVPVGPANPYGFGGYGW